MPVWKYCFFFSIISFILKLPFAPKFGVLFLLYVLYPLKIERFCQKPLEQEILHFNNVFSSSHLNSLFWKQPCIYCMLLHICIIQIILLKLTFFSSYVSLQTSLLSSCFTPLRMSFILHKQIRGFSAEDRNKNISEIINATSKSEWL